MPSVRLTDRRVVHIIPLAASMLLVPAFAGAQASGTISGLVTDATAAAVRGVAIELTNRDTGLTRRSSTGPDGVYMVPLLPPGFYDVKARLPGFAPTVHEGVRVSVAETTRVNLTLVPGPLTAEVIVRGGDSLVETATATLGVVIDARKIAELPLNGRNFAQLGTLLPGVVAAFPSLGGLAGDATPGALTNPTGSFTVNGMGNTSNNFLLDGATNNDTLSSGFVLRPPPDAIQEFKILTHSYSAEYGRNAGAVVDVATRAGTNTWQGALWEFNRDDRLQARNVFADPATARPPLTQNQYGGTISGPVAANRLFAAAYYEGYRRRAGVTTRITVPSAAQRAGDFSGRPPIRDPDTGLPFPGNVIPPERLDPIALRLLNEFVPLPDSGPNTYTASPVVRDDRDQAGLRVDFRPDDRHAVLGRYLWSRTRQVTPPTVKPSAQVAAARLQDVMVSYTWIASPNIINVARASTSLIRSQPEVASGRRNIDYGIDLPNINPRATGLTAIAIAGYLDGPSTIGDPYRILLERDNEVIEFANDLTWIRGRHSWKFGGDIRRDRIRMLLVQRPNGNIVFSGARTGDGAADFLLGRASEFSITTANTPQDGHRWAYAAYAQDQFRLGPALTLDLGLRYELPIPFVHREDALVGIDMGRQSVRYPDAPRGLVYPGDPGVPRGIVRTDKDNVAPRLGLVWDPRGEGRTAVRAGWGKYFDTIPGQADFYASSALAAPFAPALVLIAPTPITLASPLAALSGSPAQFPPNLAVLGWGTDYQTPYAYHYNVGVQQQIGDDLGVELGYVGTRGHHLPIFIEINPGRYEPGQTTRGARVFPEYSLVRPTFSAARSWYDALQATVRLRPVRGISLLGAYTWSHAIDHMSAPNLATERRPILPALQDDRASIARALAAEKGNAAFDVRHRFVLSFTYDAPALETRGGLARALLGGWQLHGIVQGQTGFPVHVTGGVNSDIRYMTTRPDVICDPDAGPKTTAEWFETSCLVARSLVESAERNGNLGRNAVRGPGFTRTDLALVRTLDLAPGHRLQLRVEGFNVFNQAHLDQPAAIVGAANFGSITSTAGDNRIIQLGIKYSF